MMLSDHFYAFILWSKHHIFCFQTDHELELSLFHTHCKDCVIIMLIITKTLFYWANAYENGFLNVFSTGNLLNSQALWQSFVCAKEWKYAVHMSAKRSFQHSSPKKTYVDFLHFSGVSCQKRIEMNIKWIRITKPVLISQPLNWFNNKRCTGVEA